MFLQNSRHKQIRQYLHRPILRPQTVLPQQLPLAGLIPLKVHNSRIYVIAL